jgi:hypothetical protein
MLAVPLVVLGAAVLAVARLLPMNWVLVCPRGLLRTRGAVWDGISWEEVDRFEDATLRHKGVTIRQCRLVRKNGTAWGFLADQVSGYSRLCKVLRRKVNERDPPSSPAAKESVEPGRCS